MPARRELPEPGARNFACGANYPAPGIKGGVGRVNTGGLFLFCREDVQRRNFLIFEVLDCLT